MLPVTWNTTRLFLHVLAATVWVGGQIALAGMVPGARKIDPGSAQGVGAAVQHDRLARVRRAVRDGVVEPRRGVEVPPAQHRWGITLFVKLLVVALSGVSAFAHQRSKGTLGLAVWGSLTGASAIGAVWVGIMLHG